MKENTPTNLPPTNPGTPADQQLMRVGVLALDIRWADPQSNLDAVRECLERNGHRMDLLVLPELFTTAFSQDIEVLKAVAQDDRGETITTLTELSHTYDVAIAGSYLARTGDNFYNRGFFITPQGSTAFYNKRHLFGLSAESRLFSAGQELPAVVQYKGWRIATIICYDLRFPVWCRRHDATTMYDMLLVPANWPVSRRYAWEHLLIARAIENQAVTVGADRSGDDDYGNYDGMTYVCDSSGHAVECEIDGKLSIATVDLEAVTELRRRWPVANDADTYCLQ